MRSKAEEQSMKKITAIIISATIAVSFTTSDSFAFVGTDSPSTATNTTEAGSNVTVSTTGATSTTTIATTETTSAAATDDTGQTTSTSAPTLASTAPAPKPPRLAAPSKLRAYSGYDSVRLTWEAVPKAEEYLIYRSKVDNKQFKRVGKTDKPEYVDRIRNKYADYAYRVVATVKFNNTLIKSPPAKIRQNSVRRMRVYITFKTDEKFSTGTIRKGTRLMSDGYGGGYYIFDHKGKRHAVPRIAVRDASSKYEKNENYSKTEASLFINDYIRAHKISTDRKYLIWVSSYTQHLYVFKKKKGRWKVARSWEISTGRAIAPTSSGNKVISRKVLSHHDVQFWNCFSGWNALHGISGNMYASLGRPASHGCVRSANDDAAWLYLNREKGTPVIIY